MSDLSRIVEQQILDAIERGEFDDLAGRGQPLDLSTNPFEHPLAGTFRRILRDNDATHPVLEARKAIEEELEDARRQYVRDRREDHFRQRLHALNREIKLFNLKSPLPNFHLRTIDPDAEINGR